MTSTTTPPRDVPATPRAPIDPADLAPGTVVEVETKDGQTFIVHIAAGGCWAVTDGSTIDWPEGWRITRVFAEVKEPTPIRPEDVSREVARVVLTSTDPAVHLALADALRRAGWEVSR